ncbi:MAG: right-handed parallel beta-helix repeat-containing protein, partial [Thermoplasmata archaeon]|nr:right-handed parallel beta-helix repeat-containing protein [Thermoplasmata archaeon]
MVTAVFASVLTMPGADSPLAVMRPKVLIVGAGGEFETISSAMSAANIGDVIRIGPGNYNERTVVDRSVTIIGTVDENNMPMAETSTMIVIANNVAISGLTFNDIKTVRAPYPARADHWAAFGWNAAGILTMPWMQVIGPFPHTFIQPHIIQGLRVTSCTFINCWQGIYLTGATGAQVTDCDFYSCYRGITIRAQYVSPNPADNWESGGHTITGCDFNDQRYFDNDINQFSDTENGEAIAIFESVGNKVIGGTMAGNTFGIHIYKGTDNVVQGVTISDSTVAPMSFREVNDGVTVQLNTITEVDKPILFYDCHTFTFHDNTIIGATLTLVNSTGGTITDSKFEKTDTPALSVGTQDHHYEHDIGQSNTIGLEPIYYAYNEANLVLRDRDASAVYIMNCD